MTGRVPEAEEGEAKRDRLYSGCLLESLGCATEGCLSAAIPFLLLFVWMLS